MVIISHRGYLAGVDFRRENDLLATTDCFKQGWGIELDIRRSPQAQFYFSHECNEHSALNDAVLFCSSIRSFNPPQVAVNIKELGYEEDLIEFLERERIIEAVFLFDMELLEDEPGRTARIFRRLNSEIRLAARSSDRSEPIERALNCPTTSVIWADEFDRLWLTEDHVRRAKEAGKQMYAISPEIHGFSQSERDTRWQQFHQWGVDGVCTDYPEDLQRFLTSTTR